MENKRGNEYQEKPYNSDAQYSFSSRNSTSRGYNLTGHIMKVPAVTKIMKV